MGLQYCVANGKKPGPADVWFFGFSFLVFRGVEQLKKAPIGRGTEGRFLASQGQAG